MAANSRGRSSRFWSFPEFVVTGGAICSIAFGEKTPILDGNVARVLSRVFMISGSPKEKATLNELWKLSMALVESSTDSSALNQCLMELGATVCLPRQALCNECPLKRNCGAHLTSRVDEFPNPSEKQRSANVSFIAMIVQKNGAVLVRKRAANLVNAAYGNFQISKFRPRMIRRGGSAVRSEVRTC
jgi:A/G-specific adenine glycosylase